MSEFESTSERFVEQQLRSYASSAIESIAPVYLPEDHATRFAETFEYSISEDEKGFAVPYLVYGSEKNPVAMIIEKNELLAYAESIVDNSTEEIPTESSSDFVKVLVGAGVAKAILGYKMLNNIRSDQVLGADLHEKHFDKTPLLAFAQHFDLVRDTRLEEDINRLSDDKVREINTLRYAVGVSLGWMSLPISWLQQWQPTLEERLMVELDQRKRDFDTARGIYDDIDDAFKWYDDATPTLEIALSFPMSPGEEADSFASS